MLDPPSEPMEEKMKFWEMITKQHKAEVRGSKPEVILKETAFGK